MIDFLKNFFAGEKNPEEKALMGAQVKRDVMMVGNDGAADDAAEDESCATAETYSGGCGGCGCRR